MKAIERRGMWVALFVLLAGLGIQTAYGLDPHRTLTQYVHRIWQMQQGLPQSTILAIGQSSDGYLWLGTDAGVVRFDGARFTVPDDPSGAALGETWVRSVWEDQRHNLWLGTNDAGLVRLANGVFTRYTTADGLPSLNVRCVAPGRNGELWICTPNGLARFAGGKFTVYKTAQGLSTDSLRAACETAGGEIWAGGDSNELNIWDGTRFRRRRLAAMSRLATVRTMLAAGDGAIWIGTTDGLIRLKDGRERRFTTSDGLSDNSILSLAPSREGGIWIGAKDGFSRFLNGEIETFRTKDGLSQSTVYAVYEDREGSLWVGTKHGLNQFVDGRTIPFTVNEGLPSNDAGPVFEDSKGNTWVGTLGAGLGRYDGRRFSALTTKQGLASNTVYALAEDNGGDLWVGTSAGASRLRNGRVAETYTTAQGLPGNAVRCLFRDHHGSLWAGTSAGAAEFRGGRFVPAGGTGGIAFLGFGEDRERRLFAATGGGLKTYAGGRFREFTGRGSDLRDVDALFQDREGFLWMGTLGGGLRLLKDGKVVTYWMRDGLFDDAIYGVASDDRDRLWMACSKGIFSVNRSDLLKFAAGEIRKFASTPYSPMDALRTIECQSGVQPAVWRMRDGRLWFSTIRGLIVLDPSRLEHAFAPPPVVIEEVTVNGKPEMPGHIESLPPGRKNLEFRYTGLSFRVPLRITFRYLLQGFDKNWVDAGARREVLYANLPPGKYVFRATACNADGTCNQTGTSVAFVLAPHYYQRGWFLPLCALLAAMSVWLAYRLRIRGLKREFDIVLTERSRIARELHDTLIQGFSGITMELQALYGRLSSAENKRTLAEVIQDAAECLREARRSVAGLRGPRGANSGLAAAIAQSSKQITEAKDVRLKLKLGPNPRALPADVEYNLLRIAQEAVTNSVKHARARTIEVFLDATADSVRLAVADDGSGFTASNGGAEAGHYGLIGMRERASQIGAGLEIKSEPGMGTRVELFLPWKVRNAET
jgi:ligand-binding sensor domain-containing protein